MRVTVTAREVPSPADLRSSGEVTPHLALPWVLKLRYGVLIGQSALILILWAFFDVPLPVLWLALPLAIVAVTNLLMRHLGFLLVVDTLCLTALLALTGGSSNPFSLLYIVQIALSAVILSRTWTWALGGLSAACFGLLFWVNRPLELVGAHHGSHGYSVHLIGMWLAFAATALLITIFIGKVSEVLRRREQDVLHLQNQLSKKERLASLVTLAAGSAHELGTPLATIAIASKELEHYGEHVLHDPAVTDDARLMRAEVERCRRILERMSLRGAEPLGEAPVPVDLAELFEQVRAAQRGSARGLLQVSIDPQVVAAVLPPEAARQALAALVHNAFDASPEGSPVRLSASRDGARLVITVQDSGHGMSREVLEHVAEPFFTTKEPGRGMGFGTLLARIFAESLGGELIFDSEPGRGTTAALSLPEVLEWKPVRS